ncbi:MAG: helix-hairpin-helix domain-containing protein [Lewinellaceae bacterium]|nr:helix-hairpin-helix domain-containing protein [Lewinellaceae bacterium]
MIPELRVAAFIIFPLSGPVTAVKSRTLNVYRSPENACRMKDWVKNRILEFFNRVKVPADIIGRVEDDPSDGPGRSIGPVLARRIIEYRNRLPVRRFKTFDELDAVPGVGPNTLSDLEYSFDVPAADFFENSLFSNHVLPESWTLLHYEWEANNLSEFRKAVDDEGTFRDIVRSLATRACMETAGMSPEDSGAATEPLLTQYIDAYHNSTEEGALAFALWFYRFDADNWFSFERMFQQTSALFGYHAVPLWEMEMRFFKGFKHRIFTKLIAPPDLPVLVNYPEHKVTLWVSGLAD